MIPDNLKTNLRASLRQSLRAVTATQKQAWDAAITTHLAQSGLLNDRAVIALYMPLPHEVMVSLPPINARLCLPVVVARDQPMVFRAYDIGDPLQKGPCGTMEPLPDQAILVPDAILLPMLGFGTGNVRLGMGGGLYDRTLALLPHATTIGLAYQIQHCPDLTPETHDRALDCIITESEIHQ